MKKVTIVIPTYKRPDRIERAVKSALMQSYQNIEVIVVDDNGKDTSYSKETIKVLEEYITNKKIKYIINDVNKGGSYSRNQGLDNSNGEYITFLDDDDEISAEKIRKQVEKLEDCDNSYSCVYTAYNKIMGNNKVYKSAETVEGRVYKYALSRSIFVGSGSNLLVKTNIAKEIGGYDISFKRNQDLEFMARVLKNYKLAYVDEDLLTIHYEIRENKPTYESLVAIDKFFMESFKEEIATLSSNEQKEIISIIALERFRYSLKYNILDGIINLMKNKVSIISFIRYVAYVIKRVTEKKSFGFKLK